MTTDEYFKLRDELGEEEADKRLQGILRPEYSGEPVPQEPTRQSIGTDLSAAKFPFLEPEPAAAPVERPGYLKQFVNDLGRGTDILTASGGGLLAAAGEMIGSEGMTGAGLDIYMANMEEVAANPAVIGSFTNIKSVDDGFRYLLEAVGENALMMLPGMATGGFAGIVGKRMLRTAAEEAVERLVKTGVSRAAATKAVTLSIQDQAKARARDIAFQTAGAYPTSVGMETGLIAGEMYEQTGEVDGALALAGGSISGALDTIPNLAALRMATGRGTAEKVVKKFYKELGGNVAKEFFMEAPTELMQEIINAATVSQKTGEDIFTEEKIIGYIDAFLKGGLGSVPISATATTIGRLRRDTSAASDAFQETGEREQQNRTTPPPADGEDTTTLDDALGALDEEEQQRAAQDQYDEKQGKTVQLGGTDDTFASMDDKTLDKVEAELVRRIEEPQTIDPVETKQTEAMLAAVQAEKQRRAGKSQTTGFKAPPTPDYTKATPEQLTGAEREAARMANDASVKFSQTNDDNDRQMAEWAQQQLDLVRAEQKRRSDAAAPGATNQSQDGQTGKSPGSYPGVAGSTPAPATPGDAVADFGRGLVDGLYTMLFGKLQAGDTTEVGKPSRVLEEAMPAFQAGVIKTPEDLRKWVNGDPAMREAFQKTQPATPAPAAVEVDPAVFEGLESETSPEAEMDSKFTELESLFKNAYGSGTALASLQKVFDKALQEESITTKQHTYLSDRLSERLKKSGEKSPAKPLEVETQPAPPAAPNPVAGVVGDTTPSIAETSDPDLTPEQNAALAETPATPVGPNVADAQKKILDWLSKAERAPEGSFERTNFARYANALNNASRILQDATIENDIIGLLAAAGVEDAPSSLLERDAFITFAQQVADIRGTAPAAEAPAAPAQRDVTKPEQMTPEEAGIKAAQADIAVWKELFPPERIAAEKAREGSSIAEERIAFLESQITSGEARAKGHIYQVENAAKEGKPVSVSAVESYGIKLPEGYAKQGDLYVYQPKSAPATTPTVTEAVTPAASETPAAPAEAAPKPFGQRLLDAINEKLDNDETVYISTATQATPVTKKARESWNKSGRPLFKVGKDGNLYMGRGKRYDVLTSAGRSLVGISANGKPLPVDPDPVTVEDTDPAPAEPKVTIKRSKDFSESGEYEVTIGDKTYRIFRDRESKYWYDADRLGGPSGFGGLLSTQNREEAIEELKRKYQEDIAEEAESAQADPKQLKDVEGRPPNESGVYQPTETIELAQGNKKSKGGPSAAVELTAVPGRGWTFGFSVMDAELNMGGGFAPSVNTPFFEDRNDAVRGALNQIERMANQGGAPNESRASQAAAKRILDWVAKERSKLPAAPASAATQQPAPKAEAPTVVQTRIEPPAGKTRTLINAETGEVTKLTEEEFKAQGFQNVTPSRVLPKPTIQMLLKDGVQIVPAGPQNADFRQRLMEEMGTPVPKSKAGVDAVTKELGRYLGVPDTPGAVGFDDKVRAKLREMLGEPTTQPAPKAEEPALKPDLRAEAGIVLMGDDAKNADHQVALAKKDKFYTLWVSFRLVEPDGVVRRAWEYLTILGQNYDEAKAKAVDIARRAVNGEKVGQAFTNSKFKWEPKEGETVGLLDEVLNPEDLGKTNPVRGALGTQKVGFGKYADTLVDDLPEVNMNYTEWLVDNATTTRAKAVVDYLLQNNPKLIEYRIDQERIAAYEKRQAEKTLKPQQVSTENTTTDNKVVNRKVEKKKVRKAAEQIVDIIAPGKVENKIPATLSKHMFPIQVAGANATINSLDNSGAALNGDGAGVGKTRQILAVANHYAKQGVPVLIITENAAIGKPWEGRKTPVLGGSMAKDSQAMGVSISLLDNDEVPAAGKIKISTYNRVQASQVTPDTVVIFDESQNLANTFGDISKPKGQWKDKFGPIFTTARKIAFYSATPADKPHQLSYLYKVLGFGSPQEYLDEAQRNGMIIRTRRFGNKETQYYDVPGNDGLKRKLYGWVNGMIQQAGAEGRAIKREISYEGTDVQFHDTTGTNPEKNPWAEKFLEVMADMNRFMADGWFLPAAESHILYSAELAKIGDAVNMVKRELAAGRKAVLFFSRIREHEIRGRKRMVSGDGETSLSEPVTLAKVPSPVTLLREELEKLGISYAELHGESGDTSKTAQEKFSKNVDVLLASVESGGTGINLDDPTGKNPRTEIFMFAPYRGISTIQAMGRVWRASTVQDDDKPNRYIFVVASDIKQDAVRSAVLAKKLQLMNASLGGTAVSRLPMSKVGYSPDQLAGLELPDDGVESPLMGADGADFAPGPLLPVTLQWKQAKSGNYFARANADVLEWVERGGPERTGLNIRVFKGDRGWVALADEPYGPERFELVEESKVTDPTPVESQPGTVPDPVVVEASKISSSHRRGRPKKSEAKPAIEPDPEADEAARQGLYRYNPKDKKFELTDAGQALPEAERKRIGAVAERENARYRGDRNAAAERGRQIKNLLRGERRGDASTLLGGNEQVASIITQTKAALRNYIGSQGWRVSDDIVEETALVAVTRTLHSEAALDLAKAPEEGKTAVDVFTALSINNAKSDILTYFKQAMQRGEIPIDSLTPGKKTPTDSQTVIPSYTPEELIQRDADLIAARGNAAEQVKAVDTLAKARIPAEDTGAKALLDWWLDPNRKGTAPAASPESRDRAERALLDARIEVESRRKAEERDGEETGPEVRSDSRVISRKEYNKALKALRGNLSKLGIGVDPTIIKDLIVVGAYHAEQGYRKFKPWAEKMLSDLGESVRSVLRKIYGHVKAVLRGTKTGFDTKAVVAKTNIPEAIPDDREITEMVMRSSAETDAAIAEQEDQSTPGTVSMGLEMDKERIFKLLGERMYNGDLGNVVIKEVSQNSFDAIKDAEELGIIGRGEGVISYNIYDEGDDSVTMAFADNGVGMTPDILQRAFFTVGGTHKRSGKASGGFGLAKMAMFMTADRVYVETVNNGIVTIADISRQQLMQEQFSVAVSQDDTRKNGTMVRLTFPKNFQTSDGKEKKFDEPWWDPSSSISHNVLILTKKFGWGSQYTPAVEEWFRGPKSDNGESLPVALVDSSDQYTLSNLRGIIEGFREGNPKSKLVEKTVQIGAVTVRMSGLRLGVKDASGAFRQSLGINPKAVERRAYKALNASYRVFSNGLRQFESEERIKIDPKGSSWDDDNRLPWHIIVDIDAGGVDAASVEYPFTNNREGLRDGPVEEAIAEFINELRREEALSKFDNEFKPLRSLTGGDPTKDAPALYNNTTYDPAGGELNFLKGFSKAIFTEADEFVRVLRDAYDLDLTKNYWREVRRKGDVEDNSGGIDYFYGAGLSKNWGGVNTSREPTVVLVNPVYRSGTRRMLETQQGRKTLAAWWVHILMHEINHAMARNEGAEFTYSLSETDAILKTPEGNFNKSPYDKAVKRMYDLVEKYVDDINSLAKNYEDAEVRDNDTELQSNAGYIRSPEEGDGQGTGGVAGSDSGTGDVTPNQDVGQPGSATDSEQAVGGDRVGDEGGQQGDAAEGTSVTLGEALTRVGARLRARRLGVYSPQRPTLRTNRLEARAGDKGSARSYSDKLRFLLPAERAKLRSNTTETFVEQFTNLPSEKEMAAVAIGGQAKRGWYERSARAILAIFGADTPRFTALLASTSPQTSVEDNLINTLNIWRRWKAAKLQTSQALSDFMSTEGAAGLLLYSRIIDNKQVSLTPQQAKQRWVELGGDPALFDLGRKHVELMGSAVQGSGTADSLLEAWVGNSIRSLNSAAPQDLVLSGPKVNSFMLNLRGVANEVTNDAWMANFALVDQKIFSGSLSKAGTDPGKGPGYLAMSARVRATANYLTKLTGEVWTPAEVQETIWSWAKTLYELQDRKGETRTALEILRDGDLTDAAIASTPDFATLLTDGIYREILTQAGYGTAIAKLAKSSARSTGTTGRRFDPEADPAIGAAVRAGQERSARRLAALREKRLREKRAKAAKKLGARSPGEIPRRRLNWRRATAQEKGRFGASRLVDMVKALYPGVNVRIVTDEDTVLAADVDTQELLINPDLFFGLLPENPDAEKVDRLASALLLHEVEHIGAINAVRNNPAMQEKFDALRDWLFSGNMWKTVARRYLWDVPDQTEQDLIDFVEERGEDYIVYEYLRMVGESAATGTTSEMLQYQGQFPPQSVLDVIAQYLMNLYEYAQYWFQRTFNPTLGDMLEQIKVEIDALKSPIAADKGAHKAADQRNKAHADRKLLEARPAGRTITPRFTESFLASREYYTPLVRQAIESLTYPGETWEETYNEATQLLTDFMREGGPNTGAEAAYRQAMGLTPQEGMDANLRVVTSLVAADWFEQMAKGFRSRNTPEAHQAAEYYDQRTADIRTEIAEKYLSPAGQTLSIASHALRKLRGREFGGMYKKPTTAEHARVLEDDPAAGEIEDAVEEAADTAATTVVDKAKAVIDKLEGRASTAQQTDTGLDQGGVDAVKDLLDTLENITTEVATPSTPRPPKATRQRQKKKDENAPQPKAIDPDRVVKSVADKLEVAIKKAAMSEQKAKRNPFFETILTGTTLNTVRKQFDELLAEQNITEQDTEAQKQAKLKRAIVGLVAQVQELPIAKRAFEEAKAKVYDSIDEGKIVLNDEQLASLEELEFDDTKIPNAIKVLKGSLNMRELVRRSLKAQRTSLAQLASEIAEAARLSPEQANTVAKALAAEYRKSAREEIEKAIAQLVKSNDPAIRKAIKSKSTHDKLFEAANLGALRREAVWNAIANNYDLPSFDPAFVRKIEKEAQRIQDLPENSQQRNLATRLLMTDIAYKKLSEAKGFGPKALRYLDIFNALWKAGILSGPPTQLVNFGFSHINLLLTAASKAQALAKMGKVNNAKAAKSYLGYLSQLLMGTYSQLGRAKNEAANALNYGYSRFQNEKIESLGLLEGIKFDKNNKFNPANLLSVAKYVGRFMQASDALNSSMASEMSQKAAVEAYIIENNLTPKEAGKLRAQVFDNSAKVRAAATAQADQEAAAGQFGEPGPKANRLRLSRIEELVEREREKYVSGIIDKGRAEGERIAYNNPADRVIGYVMRGLFAPLNRTLRITQPLMPFPNTIANLLNTSIDYTPYGFLRARNKSLSDMLAKSGLLSDEFAPREIKRGSLEYQETVSKAWMGTIGMAAMIALVMKSLADREEEPDEEPFLEITAEGPSDLTAREQLKTTGWMPYTVKIGGLRLRYTDWPALNLVMGALGTITDNIVYNRSKEIGVLQAAISVFSTTLDRNMLSGLSDFFDIVNNPNQRGANTLMRLGLNYAGGVTNPNFFRWMRNTFAVDETGMVQRLEQRTLAGKLASLAPFSGGYGQASLNVFAEPIRNFPLEPTANRFGSFFDKEHPVITPLAKSGLFLTDPAYQVVFSIPKPGGKVDDYKLTPEEQRDFTRIRGPILLKKLTPATVRRLTALASRDYDTAKEELQKISTSATQEAKAIYARRKGWAR